MAQISARGTLANFWPTPVCWALEVLQKAGGGWWERAAQEAG